MSLGLYSSFPYDSLFYGDGSGPGEDNLRWGLEIDWDGDGIFDGSNEAYNLVDLSIQRGRQSLLSGNARGFNDVKVGSADLVLENPDGRYDPRNTSSPLYGMISPGKLIRLTVGVASLETSFPVFCGRITDIRPTSGRQSRVRISAEDGIRKLLETSVEIPVQESIRVDDAIEMILDGVSWPTVWGRQIDISTESLPFWWMTSQDKAWETLSALIRGVSLGDLFVNRSGAFVFHSRHRQFSTTALTDSDLLKDVTLPQPWESIRSDFEVRAHPITRYPEVVLYTSGQPTVLPAGETVEIWGSYSYLSQNCAAMSVIPLEKYEDYEVSDSEEGGVDRLSDVSASIEAWPTDFKLSITNTHATDSLYLNFLQVRGDALVTDATIRHQGQSSTFPAGADSQLFLLDEKWQQNPFAARDFVELLKTRLENSSLLPKIMLEAQPTLQFGFDLFDGVHYTSTTLGIDDDFVVGGIDLQWLSPSGQAVRTTLYLEPSPEMDLTDVWDFTITFGASSPKFAA